MDAAMGSGMALSAVVRAPEAMAQIPGDQQHFPGQTSRCGLPTTDTAPPAFGGRQIPRARRSTAAQPSRRERYRKAKGTGYGRSLACTSGCGIASRRHGRRPAATGVTRAVATGLVPVCAGRKGLGYRFCAGVCRPQGPGLPVLCRRVQAQLLPKTQRLMQSNGPAMATGWASRIVTLGCRPVPR